MKNEKGTLIGAALLIAGTAIGAGMLALPLKTGVAGFGPAMLISILSWFFMLCTGLLFLEVTLWMPDMSNLLSMARRFLGIPGQVVAGIGFLFLYYCLLVAYFSGGVPIVANWMPTSAAYPVFALVLGGVVFLGAHVADRLNFLLMSGLIISYALLVGGGVGEIELDNLAGRSWPLAFAAIPTVFAAYGYHNIVPSMSTYLHRDGHKLRWAIFLGTCVPLVIYSLWQWMIIGAIPQEELRAGLEEGIDIAGALALAGKPWIAIVARYFSLFAVVTSVIGVALSMVDFLGDGTKIPRKGFGRLILVAIVFVPPLVFAWESPAIFYDALHYAGVYGEAILNGFFPIVMVWVGRYYFKLQSDYQLPGGRITLTILLLITLVIVAVR